VRAKVRANIAFQTLSHVDSWLLWTSIQEGVIRDRDLSGWNDHESRGKKLSGDAHAGSDHGVILRPGIALESPPSCISCILFLKDVG
jgi:lipoate-protein ligase A